MNGAVSAIGTKRTSLFAPHMSAFGGKAAGVVSDRLLGIPLSWWLGKSVILGGLLSS